MSESKNDKLPPQAVRIKRKRGADPLKGLFLDSTANKSQKRSRTDSFVFKLAGTFDREPEGSIDIELSEDDNNSGAQSGEKRKRVFHFPRSAKRKRQPSNSNEQNVTSPQTEEENTPSTVNEEKIPDQISEMVQNYLDVGQVSDPLTADHEVEDYVYDIYYREPYNPQKWESNALNIGVIVVDSDDDMFFNQDDDGSDFYAASDDEDSNAEDFYRNDYPEDEDAFSSLDEDSRGLREGLEYLGIDDRKDASRDPEEDDNWSEDENYEQYRDRIFGDLEKEIAKANQDN